MLPDFGARRALMLQGPVGPFFRRLARQFQDQGVEVTKVNFNAGDGLFFRGPEVVRYRQPMDEWPDFFRQLVAERNIDTLFLSGDCRPLHKQAIALAPELGVAVWVFEEGYLRPDHVTVERGGVNGNSSMSRDPDFYRRATSDLPELHEPVSVGNTFRLWGWITTAYSVAMTFLFWRYPLYRHHRNNNAFWQAFCWVRGAARKFWYAARERGVISKIRGEWAGRYFMFPLQVHCDSQLEHSTFESMEQLMDTVVASFAEHAPDGVRLVVKHHPHDRGYREYGRYLRELGERYGCADRIVYVHDVHLPTLLKNALGTVTMNSTVGTSSMYHGAPVKVLGTAVYDIAGLTCKRSLAEFWVDPGSVDGELFVSFCRWLRGANQLNGSFYKRAPGIPGISGVSLVSAETEVPSVAPELRERQSGIG